MRIGVVSDLHLGHKNCNLNLFKITLQQLQQKQVDFIVDCGDIIDHNYITAIEAEELRKIFSDLSVDYHIVRGNHDTLANTSVSSLLSLNKNIYVHNKTEIYNDVLFVPYVNNVTELMHNLKELKMSSAKTIAFSHLNLTSNIYAMLPFEKAQNLFLYADNWFNGHIHMPEQYNSVYGNIYNVGSVSSLTYGDEHIPCYCILEIDHSQQVKFMRYNIQGSLIHKTLDIISDTDYNKLSLFYENNREYNIAWRIRIPNSFSMVDREKIRNIIMEFYGVKEIQFSYLMQPSQVYSKIDTKQEKTKTDVSLMEQLFSNYEKDKKITLDSDLKKELLS